MYISILYSFIQFTFNEVHPMSVRNIINKFVFHFSAKKKSTVLRNVPTGGGPMLKVPALSIAEELILEFLQENRTEIMEGIPGGVDIGNYHILYTTLQIQ